MVLTVIGTSRSLVELCYYVLIAFREEGGSENNSYFKTIIVLKKLPVDCFTPNIVPETFTCCS